MINYIIPEYKNTIGDCCRVKDTFGDKVYEKKMTSVLKDIYKERCVNINYLKHKSSKILNQKHLIPIYLSKEEVLIPIKVRKPKVLSDGVHGLLNACLIERIEKNYIILKDGTKVNFIDSKRSILKRIHMSKILKENFNDKTMDMLNLKDHLLEPATKEDIAIIIRELAYIKRSINL